jgi:hypothetical protein
VLVTAGTEVADTEVVATGGTVAVTGGTEVADADVVTMVVPGGPAAVPAGRAVVSATGAGAEVAVEASVRLGLVPEA